MNTIFENEVYETKFREEVTEIYGKYRGRDEIVNSAFS
jgi:hypothetical protein